jgi:hypothetical protein
MPYKSIAYVHLPGNRKGSSLAVRESLPNISKAPNLVLGESSKILHPYINFIT